MDAAFLLLQGVLQTYEAGTGAGRNAMKLGIHCVRTYLVFRSYAAAACQAARTAVICSGSG
jgi:hypothetical protein